MMKTKLSQKLVTSITVTPQLQQVLKFLQMSNSELMEEILKEFEENPVVEILEDEREMTEHDLDGKLEQVEKEYFRFKRQNFEQIDSLEGVSKEVSLVEYIISQINELRTDSRTKEILIFLAHHLNRDGFRAISDAEAAKVLNVGLEEVQKAILLFKNIDPVGIGAMNAIESLIWQLEAMGFNETALPVKLITDFKDFLQRGRLDIISKKYGYTMDQLYEALKILRKLNPRPGLQYDNDYVAPVTVDLTLRIEDTKLIVDLARANIPKIKVKKEYLKCGDKVFEKTAREHFRNVKFLHKAVTQRENSLLKIAKVIVDEQRDFFLSYGAANLKPLALKDVATKLNIHESTVSRATSNKFIETPFGVFELKYFFVNKLNDNNANASSEKVKRIILELINSENKDSPLNDADLANIINERFGIKVARRTIAKYREALKIPSASHRKFFDDIRL
ncbi:MAG: RNA polymerase factor sigma-54 [Deltaproteobacteria bacterium]|nr:RNA polymerase factor sigma-54 [Deltaproteobacteria bacterium]